MKESQQPLPTGEPEETLVTPRFDEVETVQAQPVVPFAEVPPGAHGAGHFGGRSRASWPLALVLVSALVGVVVGGAGLYFYQQRPAENAPADAQPAQASTEEPQPVPSAEESASLPPQEAEPATETGATDVAEVVSAEVVEPPAPAGDAKKEEAAKASAPEPRKVVKGDDDDAAAPRRTREPERDAEAARRTPRAERVGSREVARDDDDGEPQARLSDEIIYRRERRAERQAERRARRENRGRSVDRVRGIFEGQPE